MTTTPLGRAPVASPEAGAGLPKKGEPLTHTPRRDRRGCISSMPAGHRFESYPIGQLIIQTRAVPQSELERPGGCRQGVRPWRESDPFDHYPPGHAGGSMTESTRATRSNHGSRGHSFKAFATAPTALILGYFAPQSPWFRVADLESTPRECSLRMDEMPAVGTDRPAFAPPAGGSRVDYLAREYRRFPSVHETSDRRPLDCPEDAAYVRHGVLPALDRRLTARREGE